MILAAAIALLAVLRPHDDKVPIVAVQAADSSSSTAALTRDLLVKLGSLYAVGADDVRLVDQSARVKSSLVFQVSGATSAISSDANLVLLTGTDRSLLWSKDFQQPAARAADLKQQVGFTAAKVLDCALETFSPSAPRLDSQTLKLYLRGCGSYAELKGLDSRTVIPILLEVTKRAPRFAEAWEKLLLAEIQVVAVYSHPDSKATEAQLRRHIAEARKANPHLAAAYDAEALLEPPLEFARQDALFQKALAAEPNNSFVRMHHSKMLLGVGRMTDALEEARRALNFDRLSAEVWNNYITTLAFSGQYDAAISQLEKAERLWPGTSTIEDARFRLQLRYGDPAQALRLLSGRPGEASLRELLEARADPTPAKIERALQIHKAGINRGVSMGVYLQALGEFGRLDELYHTLLTWRGPEREERFTTVLFRPPFREFRRQPRFMHVARRYGLLRYWQSSGKWPDFCFEPDLPYDCKSEAAKVK